ncbi:MAG: sulfatase [Bacteroidales bacterium]|nr:sulfatase [Bacteroidales bacterium]
MKNIINVFLIGILFMLASACGTEKKDSPPNILFIMSDDHAYQAISAYSDLLMETPNIDRIADEGKLFNNACVTNSICAPSRAVILTGKHSHLNGKIDNIFPFDTTNITFPQILHDNGYQTAMFGKLHFGNSPKGFDQFKILPGQGNYYNPDFITKYDGNVNIEGYTTDVITDETLNWLKNDRVEGKPFLLMYLHKAPHREWLPAPRHFREYTKKTFPEPATLYDDYEGRGSAAKQAEMNLLTHMNWAGDSKIKPEILEELGIEATSNWDFKAYENNLGRMNPEQRKAWDEVYDQINEDFKEKYASMSKRDLMSWRFQRYMQDYLGSIAAVDEGVGRVLDYLEESGLAENTIVVYTSDQGFYLGEHGWFDKRFIYDESFKTPLLVRWPGITEAGSVCNEMVQNLDFAQTFLEIAGIDSPEDMQGESLIPLLNGDVKAWDRDAVYYHYYEYPAVHMVNRHYGVVTMDYKLAHFYYDVDEWEMYDRKNDPMELKNVYDDPAYAEVRADMHKKLDELRIKYKDSEELDQHFIDKYREIGVIE